MRGAIVLLAAIVGALFGGRAGAETLALCGPQAGRTYYFAGGVVTSKDAGWQDDAVSGGRTTLSRDTSGKLDLVFSDASGGVYSSRGEGGEVEALRRSADEIVVAVMHPAGSFEVYQFVREAGGKLTMVQLVSRTGLAAKAGAYMASCSVIAP